MVWRAFDGPSGWPRRLAVVLLAFSGLLVSMELAFFQYGWKDAVWDPWFGDGSVKVLDSAFSRSLPVRDAALGAGAYAFELVLEVTGGLERWRRRPWHVLLLGLVSAAMALTALFLIVMQAFVIHAFCTLCLVSAAISLSVPLLVAEEVAAAWGQVRRGRRYGLPWVRAIRGQVAA